jgi:hypothetical protein
MTITFHISETLLVERALVVIATILIFGLISIGGLYLLRRRIQPSPSSNAPWELLLEKLEEVRLEDRELLARLGVKEEDLSNVNFLRRLRDRFGGETKREDLQSETR